MRTGTAERSPMRLPQPLTQLVGREGEIAAVGDLLREAARLVTLSGPPGVGKTRLAYAVVSAVGDAFPDGVWLVPLAPLRDAELVPAAVARELGVREESGFSAALHEAVTSFLRDKRALLLLDNCEQVDVAPLISSLLAACPGLTVLATSRTALRLSAEREWPVPSLGLPAEDGVLPPAEALAGYDAIRLFVERARAVRPEFGLTAENAGDVAAVCRRLDGLPLAIELAAARIRILAPRALLAHLAQRLPLLTGGARDVPARHQTLRGALAWSWDLLAPDERVLLRRLGVFSGGFTLDAANAVCAGADEMVQTLPASPALDVLNGVDALVRQSLVQPAVARPGRTTSNVPGEARFVLLETVREFALERLAESGEATVVRRAHRRHYLALAECAGPGLLTDAWESWLARLDAEAENIREALTHDADNRDDTDDTTKLRLCAALWWHWYQHGSWDEGLGHLERALERAGGGVPQDTRAAALAGAGYLAFQLGDSPLALRRLEESVGLWRELGDVVGLVWALSLLGATLAFDADRHQTDHALARPWLEEAVALTEGPHWDGDAWTRAYALRVLGALARRQGFHEEATARLEQSLALFRTIGEPTGPAQALINLAILAEQRGDHTTARSLMEESLALRRQAGIADAVATSLLGLSLLVFRSGEAEYAATLAEEALRLTRGVGNVQSTCRALVQLGDIARYGGEEGRAFDFYEESRALAAQHGFTARLVPSLNGLGHVALLRGDTARARALFAESLATETAASAGNAERETHVAAGLVGLGSIALAEGCPRRAASLLGAARALLEAGASARELGPTDAAVYERDVDASRAILGPADFECAWEAGATMPLHLAIAEGVQMPGGGETVGEAGAVDPPTGRRPLGRLSPREVEVVRPVAAGRANLSPREREVAVLVAQGWSNRQIGEALTITERTAENHVEHILGKMGFRSRAQIATWATEEGLTADASRRGSY